ncbi:MAG: hypothetical protein P1P88_07410, partial [Bacteroidales bacterium]|nr:hypothetical protein [Bacteroidales bacterium]
FRILKAIMKTKADFCIRMSQSSDFIKEFLASGKKDVISVSKKTTLSSILFRMIPNNDWIFS